MNMNMDTEDTSSGIDRTQLFKQLVASDRPTRDKGLKALQDYLTNKRQFDELELLKLWKGLFYCMWMSDRPRAQQRLAAELAGLSGHVRAPNTFTFILAFWKTMAREWTNIDVLRMNKFLLLVRLFIRASFKLLEERSYGEEVVKHNAVMTAVPLNPTESRIPNGLRYHVLDVYLDELDEIDSPSSGVLPLGAMMEPIIYIKQKSPTKSVRLRAAEVLADNRLKHWDRDPDSPASAANGPEDGSGDDEEEEWNGIPD